ncbi:MAG: hypothetical protein RJA98_445 [Pseudomonadota bacterium]|jgi:DNA polymerase-3 subunit chi
MTDIQFHFNVADRLNYGCRLLRKATRAGVRVAVVGPGGLLNRLDQALWTFEPTEFLPHLRWRGDAVPTAAQQRTPIWLLDDEALAPDCSVLLNFGATPPTSFEQFGRLIDLVSADPEDRDVGRQRWKHYASLGHKVTGFEATA